MTQREAIEIVCTAARLAANGHERSEEIHAAIAIIKAPDKICHICEMPLSGPGKLACSARHRSEETPTNSPGIPLW